MQQGVSLRDQGFTLLELLVVVAIVAILSALIFIGVRSLTSRAQRLQCTANLRSLYIAANSFVQQNGSWPQIASSPGGGDEGVQYAKDWIAALRPFGPTEKTWICPTMQSAMGSPDYTAPGNERVDYVAMPFDDKPMTPHQWPRQPWFVERGDVHGNGNLVVFTDGSISDLKTIAAGAAPAASP